MASSSTRKHRPPAAEPAWASGLTAKLRRAAAARAHEQPSRITLEASLSVLRSSLASEIDTLFAAASKAPPGPIHVVDLFSGCGGMSAGFLAINALAPAFRLTAAADIDEVANESYAANLTAKPENVDIRKLAKDPKQSSFLRSIKKNRGKEPLVLIGCAPCQGFSSHRNAAGQNDSRNGLFSDFVTVALDLDPDVIVVENVPELLTTAYWPHVAHVRRRLEQAGYVVSLSVHNMASFGVPQDRYRTLLLASHQGLPAPPATMTGGEQVTVRQAIGHLPRIAPGDPHPDDALHVTARHRESTVATIRSIPKDGGSRPPWEGPASLQRVAERQGKPAYEDVYGRLWWDRPAITVTAYARNPASGRFCHPEQDRGLSIREAALLQGFPSSYDFTGSLDDCFRQIGNAVPPRFSAVLGLHVLGAILGAEYPPAEEVLEPIGQSFSRLIPSLKAEQRRLRAAGASLNDRGSTPAAATMAR